QPLGNDRKRVVVRLLDFPALDPCDGLRVKAREVAAREALLQAETSEGAAKRLIRANLALPHPPAGFRVELVQDRIGAGFVFAEPNGLAGVGNGEVLEVGLGTSRTALEPIERHREAAQ